MSDTRPSWCPDETCSCLYLRADRLCYGRLAEKQLDEPFGIYNTHQTCCHGIYEQIQFNSADAYYEISGLFLALKDTLDNGLYNPCPDFGIDEPLERLKKKIGG